MKLLRVDSQEFRRAGGVARLLAHAALLFAGCSIFATAVQAQSASDNWKFTGVLYGYLPQIGGSTTFGTGTTADISINPNQYLSSLNFAFMGAFEARTGPWGVFTDLLYMNASGSKSGTRDFSLTGVMIPASVTAYAHVSVKATIWTLAAEYGVVSTPDGTLDLLAGTRALYLDQHLNWEFSGNVGPFVGPGRQGSSESNPHNWDAIIGAKGRWQFGDGHSWFVPYYVDIGTGASRFTWQTYAGIGYAFSWGEVIGVWRYLDYQFSSNSSSFSLNGPAIGVAFRW